VRCSCSRRSGISHLRGAIEATGAKPGRLAISLLLDERLIPGHIVEGFEDRLDGDLIVPSEFFGGIWIRTVDRFFDHRRSDSPTLEE
jgi:hypothetical protein